MNTAYYTHFKEALVALGRRIATQPELSKYAGRFEETARNITDDRFRIALVAQFGGGKSTIFNTLCGGQEYVPTGSGLPTSACMAEATYVDASEDERCEIVWKSEAEVVASFINAKLLESASKVIQRKKNSTALKGITDLLETAGCILQGKSQGHLLPPDFEVDLSDPEVVEVLKEAVEDEVEEHRGNPSRYFGAVDLLKVARHSLQHIEAYRTFRTTSALRLPKAANYLRFPHGWADALVQEFTAEQIRFLFVKNARFFVNRAELKKLNATLVDCPGLGASAFDTAVADEAIASSNALVFLLGTTGKAISASEVKSISRFLKQERRNHIFIGYNLKSVSVSEQDFRKMILPHDVSLLNKEGLNLNSDSIICVQVRLAYRVAQLLALRANSLGEEGEADLIEKATKILADCPQDPQEAVLLLLKKHIRTDYEKFTGRKAPENIFESEDLLLETAQSSNWEKLLISATDFISARRANSILIEEGTRRFTRGLKEFETSALDSMIQAAEQTAEQSEAEIGKRERELEVFEVGYKAALDKLRRNLESQNEVMAGHFVQFFRNKLSKSDLIEEVNDLVHETWNDGVDEANQIAKQVKDTVLSQIKEAQREAAMLTKDLFVKDPEVQNAVRQAAQELEDCFGESLQQFGNVRASGEVEIQDPKDESIRVEAKTVTKPWWIFWERTWVDIGAFKSQNKAIVSAWFSDELPRIAASFAKKLIKSVSSSREKSIEKQIKETRQNLQEAADQARAIHTANGEERERKIREAKRIKKEIIWPLLEEISKKEEEIREFL